MNRSGAGSGASTTSSRVRLATTGSAPPRRLARYSAVRRGSTSTTCTSSWRASRRQRTSSPHTTVRERPNGRARTSRPPGSRTSVAEAQQRTLEFLAPLVNAGSSPMCGNSICQDRRFLARCMPELEHFFHYRNLDVSTLKELARRWAPAVAESFVKQGTHLAHADIHESIRELRHYRARLFAPAWSGSAGA